MNRTLPERIFICGFMGTGKTTVGRQLAGQLVMDFHDLDHLIEEHENRCISTIFEEDGEPAFREIEKLILLRVIRSKTGVIALGGGSLQNQHLLDHVKVNGMLVFIETPMSQIIERLSQQNHRPMVLDKSGNTKPKLVLEADLKELYEQRLPFYEQAEVTIHTADYDSMEALVTQLVKKIRYHVALH